MVETSPTFNGLGSRYGELTARQRPFVRYFDSGADKPLPGTYKTYRRMRKNPTIALARAAARMPIAAAQYSIEADEGTPDGHVKFIKDEVDRFWRDYVANAMNAWDFGCQGFENVYCLRDGGMVGVDWIKPLAPEETAIELADNSDRVIGLVQNGVHLRGGKYTLLQYEADAGLPYGNPRMEEIRESAWWPWVQASKRLDQYSSKVAGVVMVLEHPDGTSRTRDGSERPNAEIAEELGKKIASGSPIGMPRVLDPIFQDAFMTGKYDPSAFMAWQFKFLETSPGHGAELIDMLKHYESLMVRGWRLPERAILEGQFGTKAEASAHGDIGVQIAEDFTHDIEDAANEQIIDTLTYQNFGYRGRIRVRIAPLIDERLARIQEVYMKVLENPTFADSLISEQDFDVMNQVLGIPTLSKMRDIAAQAKARGQTVVVTPVEPEEDGGGQVPQSSQA